VWGHYDVKRVVGPPAALKKMLEMPVPKEMKNIKSSRKNRSSLSNTWLRAPALQPLPCFPEHCWSFAPALQE